MYQLAKHGHPAMYYSFETPIEDLIHDLGVLNTGKQEKELTKREFKKSIKEVDALPIYWYDITKDTQKLSVEKFAEQLELAKVRYGIQFVVLDNLATFNALCGNAYKNNLENEDNIIQHLKVLTRKLEIHLIVVAHLKDPGQEKRKLPTRKNLRGTVNFEYTPDQLIFLHREVDKRKPEDLQRRVQVLVDKVRGRGKGGLIEFDYDVDTMTYTEIDTI